MRSILVKKITKVEKKTKIHLKVLIIQNLAAIILQPVLQGV
jgi:hypothetical protein